VVGVNSGDQEAKLRDSGADIVIHDLTELLDAS
jgi:hypothetical protein